MLIELAALPEVDILDDGRKVAQLPAKLDKVRLRFRSVWRGFPRDVPEKGGDLADLLFRVKRLELLLALVVRELIEDQVP